MTLASLTIHELSEKLRKKEVSSVEITKSCLENIKQREERVKSYVQVTEGSALAQAVRADEAFAAGKDGGALHGIPVGVKDVFCTEGVRTTACSNILKDFVPPYDATVISKLKDSHMVMLGKTNTDEFTCGSSTETSCFGTTHNPWDLDRTAGGSSGGSAAALAARECIYSLGTDTGGSIRQPAAYCGISGLKVTYGRVSRFGVISMASSLDTIGPFAKDVHDIALIMNVLAGHDSRDATTPNIPVPDYTKAVHSASVKGMKIGLPKEYFIEGTDPEVKKSIEVAIEQYKKLGAEFKEISLPHSKYGLAVYYVLCPSEVSANMARYDGIRFGPGPHTPQKELVDYYLTSRGEGFGDEIKRRIMIGTYALSSGYYDAYYLKAQKVRTLVKRDFDQAFEDVDLILTPTTPSTAFKIGENSDDPVKMYLEDIFTVSINIAGVPALSIPCGFSQSGLPIGMQLIAPHFAEERLISAGVSYQNATDWHTREPKF